MKNRYGVKVVFKDCMERACGVIPKSSIYWAFETMEKAKAFINEELPFHQGIEIEKTTIIDLKEKARKDYEKLLRKAEKIKTEWNL